MTLSQTASLDFSPVRLEYVAALRGIKPRGKVFTYARLAPFDLDALMGLAASNPEGKFYGLLQEPEKVPVATATAEARHVRNLTFFAGSPLQWMEKLPPLDYIVADSAEKTLTAAERATLFAVVEQKLILGGVFAHRYRAYASPEEGLRFLVREFAPEMTMVQAREFLDEIKALGTLFFAKHPETAETLDKAIAENLPDLFFDPFLTGNPSASGALEEMEGLLPRGFAYVGDTAVGVNYLDLAAPQKAQDVLASCRDHLLFEPIKDFALQRGERQDVWCRLPIEQTNDTATLFGGFTYGITTAKDQIPSAIKGYGRIVDLTQPLYTKLIDLMTTLPMSIGDFLGHPSGKDSDPSEVLEAIQTLVALGLAQPMRGHYTGRVEAQIAHPKWASGYNSHLNDHPITSNRVLLASPIVGNVISLSAREALVIQALHRAGMEASVDVLLTELLRIATNPSLAAQIMDVAEPTPEMAHNMIQDVVTRSLLRWYAYGVLAA